METRNILIIDDEVSFCELLRMNLEFSGEFRVFIAADGEEGIGTARDVHPSLILLDIRMPGIDGFEVLKKLKANRKTMDIPVIILSASTRDDTKIKASGLYCAAYLTKPVDTDALIAKIREVIKNSEI